MEPYILFSLLTKLGSNGDLKYLDTVLEKNPNLVHAVDSKGLTPLHICCRDGFGPSARSILARGANINLQTADGFTPLHFCSHRGHFSLVHILIENGAMIDLIEFKNGCSALHLSCEAGFTKIASFLISSGADFSMLNKIGRRPLAYIPEWRKHSELADAVENVLGMKRFADAVSVKLIGTDGHFTGIINGIYDPSPLMLSYWPAYKKRHSSTSTKGAKLAAPSKISSTHPSVCTSDDVWMVMNPDCNEWQVVSPLDLNKLVTSEQKIAFHVEGKRVNPKSICYAKLPFQGRPMRPDLCAGSRDGWSVFTGKMLTLWGSPYEPMKSLKLVAIEAPSSILSPARYTGGSSSGGGGGVSGMASPSGSVASSTGGVASINSSVDTSSTPRKSKASYSLLNSALLAPSLPTEIVIPASKPLLGAADSMSVPAPAAAPGPRPSLPRGASLASLVVPEATPETRSQFGSGSGSDSTIGTETSSPMLSPMLSPFLSPTLSSPSLSPAHSRSISPALGSSSSSSELGGDSSSNSSSGLGGGAVVVGNRVGSSRDIFTTGRELATALAEYSADASTGVAGTRLKVGDLPNSTPPLPPSTVVVVKERRKLFPSPTREDDYIHYGVLDLKGPVAGSASGLSARERQRERDRQREIQQQQARSQSLYLTDSNGTVQTAGGGGDWMDPTSLSRITGSLSVSNSSSQAQQTAEAVPASSGARLSSHEDIAQRLGHDSPRSISRSHLKVGGGGGGGGSVQHQTPSQPVRTPFASSPSFDELQELAIAEADGYTSTNSLRLQAYGHVGSQRRHSLASATAAATPNRQNMCSSNITPGMGMGMGMGIECIGDVLGIGTFERGRDNGRAQRYLTDGKAGGGGGGGVGGSRSHSMPRGTLSSHSYGGSNPSTTSSSKTKVESAINRAISAIQEIDRMERLQEAEQTERARRVVGSRNKEEMAWWKAMFM